MKSKIIVVIISIIILGCAGFGGYIYYKGLDSNEKNINDNSNTDDYVYEYEELTFFKSIDDLLTESQDDLVELSYDDTSKEIWNKFWNETSGEKSVNINKNSELAQLMIAKLFDDTLYGNLYDENKIMIASYDYRKIVPEANASGEKHNLFWRYNLSPEVVVHIENRKTIIECFGNLKQYFVEDGIVALVTLTREGQNATYRTSYVDVSKKSLVSSSSLSIPSSLKQKVNEYINSNSEKIYTKIYEVIAEYLYSELLIKNLYEDDKLLVVNHDYATLNNGVKKDYVTDFNLLLLEELEWKYKNNALIEIYSENGESGEKVTVDYFGSLDEYYLSGDKLSIIAKVQKDNQYLVKNVDVTMKKEVSKDELLSGEGLDKEALKQELFDLVLSQICTIDDYSNYLQIEQDYLNGLISGESGEPLELRTAYESKYKHVIKAYQKQQEEYNFDSILFYLNENGELCCIMYYYVPDEKMEQKELRYNIATKTVIRQG